MLCLARKKGEEVRIGDDIRIIVIETLSDRVRFAIDAPKDIVIDRGEVYETKKRERASSPERSPQQDPKP